MIQLKLKTLPDRKPVKHVILLTPEQDLAVRQYTALFRQVHNQNASCDDLIPLMVEQFIDSDAAFKRAARSTGQSALQPSTEMLGPKS